jgi:hypothetical protein
MIFIILLKKTHIYIFFQIIDYQLFNFDMILNLKNYKKNNFENSHNNFIGKL